MSGFGLAARSRGRLMWVGNCPRGPGLERRQCAGQRPLGQAVGARCHRRSLTLNNLIEQDHRAIKRRIRPMPGFKDFHCAAKIIAGIEVMHMIRKGQWAGPEGQVMSSAELFYSLAF